MYFEQAQSLSYRPSVRATARGDGFKIVIFFSAHVVLALAMSQSGTISTLHALATPVVGLWWTSMCRRLERVAYVGAYMVGAEVLWRMTQAQVFWEYSKYATAALFILAMLRKRRERKSVMPFLYFALLLPSVALTLDSLGFDEARQEISFNLSGPFAFMVSAWFFSHLKLSTGQLRQLFPVMIGPIIGIAAITFWGIFTASAIKFGTASNFATSGGFGPVQVSAILGLGALLALLCVMDSKSNPAVRVLMVGVMVFLAVQSALTFSRGGLYYAAGGAVLASFYLLREANARIKFMLVMAFLFVLAQYVLLPRLDSFTGGALSARFEDTRVTGRDEIALADLRVWANNPVLGVGPGRATKLRKEGRMVAAHTEFTRLPAEHGIFGLGAALLLFIMGVRNIRRARTRMFKAVVASLVGWSFLFMSGDAMRLIAPAFALGLGFVTILREGNIKILRNHSSQIKEKYVSGSLLSGRH